VQVCTVRDGLSDYCEMGDSVILVVDGCSYDPGNQELGGRVAMTASVIALGYQILDKNSNTDALSTLLPLLS